MHTRTMRTTIEIKPEHRASLLALAARRGQKGFSQLVTEALEAYLKAQQGRGGARKRALMLKGALRPKEVERLRASTAEISRSWR